MKSVEERFWEKVDIGEENECWEWMASKNRAGYGKFRLNDRTWRAHRVAWMLTHGPIPEGLCVCHSCDHPRCCNPAHLWLGSVAENNADKNRKGRTALSEQIRLHLTKVKICDIIRLHIKTLEETMNREDKEELRDEIYEFMTAYQDEHSDEPIPPTLAEIQARFDLSGRNVALAYVLQLVEEGLVEVLDRGWRKYAAVVEEDESVTPVRVEDCLYRIPPGDEDATTKTPKT